MYNPKHFSISGEDEIQCKYKLSQNRPAADRAGAIEQLESRGTRALAAAMRKTLSKTPGFK